MITFDFEYYKPTSIEEATQLYQSLEEQGKNPLYFSGGTELITLGRVNRLKTCAVIDIKAIPECLAVENDTNTLILGSAHSLTKIREMALFPFLNKAIVEIADHVARNQITLGGNICGNIIYRESVLPLLLTESQVIIAGPNGRKQVPITTVFNETLQLEKGEFLVQIVTEQAEIDLPFLCVKKRRQWDVGYPLVTAAALKKNEQIKLAFSGLCSFPFRAEQMEESINAKLLTKEERIEEAIQRIPAPVLNDLHGSAEYRLFVLKNTLSDVLDALGGEQHVKS